MSTTSRMLVLLSLLQARRDWSGAALADRLEISERTVRRDVDRLRELGYRIQAIMGPDGGYRLDAGSDLPPLLFDDDQAVVLAVALQTVAVAGTAFEDSAARALATVRQVMPSRLRHRVDSLHLTAVTDAAPAVDPAAIVSLSAAIRASEVVRFEYAGADAVRHAEPHHLVMRRGRWYLVAWDRDRDDWRTYRVDRIALRSHTGSRFARRELPGGDAASFVAARFKGSFGDDRWPCEGEAILTLPPREAAPYAADGAVEDLGDGRSRVVLGAWSWVALAARFAQFDAGIEVVGPPELASAFATLAGRAAAASIPSA